MAAAAVTVLHSDRAALNIKTENENLMVLPPPELHIRMGTLEKQRVGATVNWEPRTAVLTAQKLYFSKKDTDIILDEIPLQEISEILQNAEQGQKLKEPPSMVIQTVSGGYNSGRTYVYRAEQAEDHESWYADLCLYRDKAIQYQERLAKKMLNSGSSFNQFRQRVLEIYESGPSQAFFASLIFASFAIDLSQAELLPPDGTYRANQFDTADTVFTVLFTLELCINLFARSKHWFKAFFADGWNILDVVIVCVSLMTQFSSGIPSMKPLRLIRVFRIAKIFRRLTSLNKIITALASALVPVGNSFLILFLVTCIWAALATHLFSWASAVTRTIFEDGMLKTSTDYGIAIFFVSYVLIAGVFLINVVVAVLLDEFISSIQKRKQAMQREHEELEENRKDAKRAKGVLDPLTSHLANFVNDVDLSLKIKQTYERLDQDGSGGLNLTEFQNGVKKLPTANPMHILEDDFDLLTDGGRLCNEEGEFSSTQFQTMMREELRRFSQRMAANAMSETRSQELKSILLMLKVMDLKSEQMERDDRNPKSLSEQDSKALASTVFDVCDKQRRGKLSMQEASRGFSYLKVPSDRHEEIFNGLGGEEEGGMTREQFLRATVFAQQQQEQQQEDRLHLMQQQLTRMQKDLAAVKEMMVTLCQGRDGGARWAEEEQDVNVRLLSPPVLSNGNGHLPLPEKKKKKKKTASTNGEEAFQLEEGPSSARADEVLTYLSLNSDHKKERVKIVDKTGSRRSSSSILVDCDVGLVDKKDARRSVRDSESPRSSTPRSVSSVVTPRKKERNLSLSLLEYNTVLNGARGASKNDKFIDQPRSARRSSEQPQTVGRSWEDEEDLFEITRRAR
ncbi:hypothetical protein GUITHDRAFT_100126 [Guillardia theta CCMP2712]|uniref:EF-hand domain-containing protein n=1 Tax=Guillardia theta (strain CCMP2712) TaxID=905079 RepID=L1K1C5_GUITC|nr:hypothetical protein GUITHDRAFT_100126 [Guillardia theta CCMP2712]EKX54651.1 hypothetical protein GUITHDRAFT_100126 [Guillardia theta CCMP2712]|eukprot:XP_005841631.1 hypothetical protein GUITHDRAFT_100126 [Guillardia theta CCMP2712]